MDLTSKETKLILSTIRRAWNRYPERIGALYRQKLAYGIYSCEECLEPKRRKQIEVDHIIPVVPVTGLDSIEGYITRLFCNRNGLRILCKGCHRSKSNKENVIRMEVRRKKKAMK